MADPDLNAPAPAPAKADANSPAPAPAAQPAANQSAAPAVDPKAGAPAADPKADPAKPVVPEKYDLKLPDGSTLAADQVEKIASFAKERGLSNDQAQALVQREHEAKVSFDEANKPGGADWTKRVSDWEKTALADKEIGGSEEALKANVEHGRRVLQKYFPESISKFLNESGFGSHPDIIRGFSKLGKMMADDRLVIPGASAGNKQPLENVFYPETKE
jgi:hypothetical protein